MKFGHWLLFLLSLILVSCVTSVQQTARYKVLSLAIERKGNNINFNVKYLRSESGEILGKYIGIVKVDFGLFNMMSDEFFFDVDSHNDSSPTDNSSKEATASTVVAWEYSDLDQSIKKRSLLDSIGTGEKEVLVWIQTGGDFRDHQDVVSNIYRTKFTFFGESELALLPK